MARPEYIIMAQIVSEAVKLDNTKCDRLRATFEAEKLPFTIKVLRNG